MKKQDFIGKSILVGLSWVDYEDNLLAQQSFFGRITWIADNMLYIDSGEDEEFTIPFDAEHIEKSDPELIYNLHDPERTVSGVDFTSCWTIYHSGDDNEEQNDDC